MFMRAYIINARRAVIAVALLVALTAAVGCADASPADEDDQAVIDRLMGELPDAEELFLLQSPPDSDAPLTLVLHGGPTPVLLTDEFQFLEDAGLPVAYLRQYQMLHPECIGFSVSGGGASFVANGEYGREEAAVSSERSRECFLGTMAVLRKVVLHFQERGRALNLAGHSVGAFMSNKYLATYGSDAFEHVVLGGARVDMPQEVVDAFASGLFADFQGGTDVMIYPADMFPNFPDVRSSEMLEFEIEGMEATLLFGTTMASELSRMRLQAATATERYSLAFAELDLGNLTYISGREDIAVGRLQAAEIAVLEGSGATVMLYDGGHDLTAAEPHIVELLGG